MPTYKIENSVVSGLTHRFLREDKVMQTAVDGGHGSHMAQSLTRFLQHGRVKNGVAVLEGRSPAAAVDLARAVHDKNRHHDVAGFVAHLSLSVVDAVTGGEYIIFQAVSYVHSP